MRRFALAALLLLLAGCAHPAPWVDETNHWGPCPEWPVSTVDIQALGFNSSLQEVEFDTDPAPVRISLSCEGPGDRETVVAGDGGRVVGEITSRSYEKVTLRFDLEVIRVVTSFAPTTNGTLILRATGGNVSLSWNGGLLPVRLFDAAPSQMRRSLEHDLSRPSLEDGRHEIPVLVNSTWNEGVEIGAVISYTNEFEGNLDNVPHHDGRVNVTLRDPSGAEVDHLSLAAPYDQGSIAHAVQTPGRWVVEVETTADSDPSWSFEWGVSVHFRY